MNIYSKVLVIVGLIIWFFSEVYEPLKYPGVGLILLAFFLPMFVSAKRGKKYSGN